jgi:hypothetical protein
MLVSLDDTQFSTTAGEEIQESFAKDFLASRSGRILPGTPPTSHPDDFESYTIDKVSPSAWGSGAVVPYSREGGIDVIVSRSTFLFLY